MQLQVNGCMLTATICRRLGGYLVETKTDLSRGWVLISLHCYCKGMTLRFDMDSSYLNRCYLFGTFSAIYQLCKTFICIYNCIGIQKSLGISYICRLV